MTSKKMIQTFSVEKIEDLSKLTTKDLKTKAKNLGLKSAEYFHLRKEPLIALIRNTQINKEIEDEKKRIVEELKHTKEYIVSDLKEKGIDVSINDPVEVIDEVSSLNMMSAIKLKAIASKMKIKDYGKMLKSELIKSIYNKQHAKDIVLSEEIVKETSEDRYHKTLELREIIEEEKKSIEIELEDLPYNEDLEIPFNNLSMELTDLLSILVEQKEYYYAIGIGNIWYTITNRNIYRIMDEIRNATTEEVEGEARGSDAALVQVYIKGAFDIVRVRKIKKSTKVREGQFFKYFHKIDNVDLSKFQIYESIKETNNIDVCLVHSLIVSGLLDKQQIEELRNRIRTDMVQAKKLNEVAEFLNIKINLKVDTNVKEILHYGTNKDRQVNLGLIDNHYFLIEKTDFTQYSINNYNKIKDLPKWYFIYESEGKYYKRNVNRCIDSFKLISLLLENKDKLLKEIDRKTVDKMLEREKITYDYTDLNYDVKEYTKEIEFKEKKEIKVNNVVFFDFETETETEVHKPYLVCYKTYNRENDTYIKSGHFEGEYCALNFLKSLTEDSLLIAHNLTYDFNFLAKHMMGLNLVEKGSKIIGGHGLFFNNTLNKNIKIYLQDSAMMIPMKLNKFGAIFNLDQAKEVIPYKLYNGENLKKKYVKITDATKLLGDNDQRIQMINNIVKWGLITEEDSSSFYHMDYTRKYCEIDCDVLALGFIIFRQWIKTATSLDIYNYKTLASIGYENLKKSGCLDGCFELSGKPRAYIQQFIVGGRCMTRNNKKIHCTDELDDFDAVSLYPSAMKRMIGFLKGSPKQIEKDNLYYEFLKQQDGYFVEINITKVNKRYAFPLINKKNEKGIRMFDNDFVQTENSPKGHGFHHVDKTTLEDLIEFQQIEFDIVGGYYYNDGVNDGIKKEIQRLFDLRVEAKKNNNPIQEVYKLLMNSSYGKSILKPITTEHRYLTKEKAKVFLSRNFSYVNSFVEIAGSNIVKITTQKSIDTHFSSPHIGCEVLSMSKRIMNEVMCLAEDNKFDIFYQDTDSMHIKSKQVKTLANVFKEKYGRELIGKQMGQFHPDFETKLKQTDKDKEKGIVSVESFFIAKKVYIDKLRVYVNGKEHYEHHIRMKGIPSTCILEHVKDDDNLNGDIMKLYSNLEEGKAYEFDLVKGSVRFEQSKNFTIKTRKMFKRNIKFI